MPRGSRLRLDPATTRFRRDVLFGGAPPRLVRLSPGGVTAFEELRRGPVRSDGAAALARRLSDVGMAHPEPPAPADPSPFTVIVPVRERPDDLAACLVALGAPESVIVVDDGSRQAAAIERACTAADCRLVRRPESGGPAAARNTGLALADTELVAFVDSDCTVSDGWLERLVGHFDDPLVGAVAPRIVGQGPPGVSPLDLGTGPARVAPGTPVAYVPTAALVVRRELLVGGFDESLRFGEDVDLVWRLLEAGWRVRYEPSVEVHHREPVGFGAQLRRRFSYGTSVGPLERRHPGNLVHLVLSPGPVATVGALLARRPLVALGAFGCGVALLHRRLAGFDARFDELIRPSATAVVQTWVAVGRYGVQFAWPLLLAVLWRPGSDRRGVRLGRRISVAALLAGPAVIEMRAVGPGWARRIRAAVRCLPEQAAYGAGVVAGCRRARVLAPLVPRWSAPADLFGSRGRGQSPVR